MCTCADRTETSVTSFDTNNSCSRAASGRTLAQVPASAATTPTASTSTSHLRYNVTLLGISEISNEEADGIKSALNMTFTQPQPAEIVVSSNTAPEDDRLTLIILVYPASTGDIKRLQNVLEETESRSAFLRNLNREADLHVENVQVNSVTLQGNSQIGGRPVTGTSLAGKSSSRFDLSVSGVFFNQRKIYKS